MKRLLALALVVACGPKPAPAPLPMLPTDGDAHTAKPPAAPVKSTTEDPWAGKTNLIGAPAVKPPAKVDLPALDEFKLSNGLQVYVVKNDRLPVVSFQVAIKAGRQQEPRARLGVAEASADMLVKGTRQHDAVALAKTIDFVGGTIGADATFEATLLSCSSLARNAQTCMSMLPEMLTQSTFPDAELAKIKDLMLASVRQRLDSADSLAAAHVQNLLWGNEHVRGWINSEQSVSAIRRDDVVAWAKTWFVPNNAMLVVAGDVDTKALKGTLERAFGGWKQAPLPPTPAFKEPGLSGIRIRLVDKPGQTQTHIRVAQFGIKHDDARFFDTLVWNYALGGGAFSSRLMKVVRVEGGKTYGASSSFDRNTDRGSFVAQTFTRNAEAVATTKLLVNEMAKMAKEGPSQSEVDAAIANIAGGYAMRYQSAGDIGAALVGAELHGFGMEYLTNFPLAVGKVDVASAKRAAGEILDPRNYVIVMVGDAKDLEPQLKKEGWRYEKVAFTDPISEAPKVAEVTDPKALAATKQILAEALAAKGGQAKVAGIKSLHVMAKGKTILQGQSVDVELDRTFVLPDKMRIDATITDPASKGQLKIVIAVNGKTGWQMQTAPGSKPQLATIPAADIPQAQFEAWREPELILLKATEPNAKVSPMPDDTIDGKPVAVVKLASPFGPDMLIMIDKKTKQLTRMSYTDATDPKHPQTETDDFADYKDVSGVKVAFKRTSTTTSHSQALDLDKVEINGTVDPKRFDQPPPP